MRQNLILLYFTYCFFFANNSYAQGAAQEGIANASVTQSDIFAISYNPAGLADLAETQLGVSNEQTLYVTDIHQINMVSAIPANKSGIFALHSQYYGNKSYKQTQVDLAYARKFGTATNVGLLVKYQNLTINNHGNNNNLSVGLGAQFEPLDKLKIGSYFFYPTSSVIVSDNQGRLVIGCSYHPNKDFLFAVNAVKEMTGPLNIRTGLAYDLHPFITIRMGGATNPVLYSIGMGTHWEKLYIDLASSWLIGIGNTPHFTLIYKLEKSE